MREIPGEGVIVWSIGGIQTFSGCVQCLLLNVKSKYFTGTAAESGEEEGIIAISHGCINAKIAFLYLVSDKTGTPRSDLIEGIDLYSLDEGESVIFMARVASTTSTKKVTVTRGACYQYSDYGYGSYLTYQYTVKFGSVSATAYCIQPEKSSPGSGTYDITKLSDGKKLAKVCYYGTKASGDDGFFTEENGYGNLSTGARFILVHLAASYANSGDSAFSGASSKAKTLAMKLYNYCISQPNIPDVEMSFSDANVTAMWMAAAREQRRLLLRQMNCRVSQ